MISRHSKRPSAPQEAPRQFAINNSKGLDFTKAATEPSSSQFFENLTVNLDGSLSIRKRMLPTYIPGTGDEEIVAVLHTGRHVLVRAYSTSHEAYYVYIRDRHISAPAITNYNFKFSTQDYYSPDVTGYCTPELARIAETTVDLSSATVVHTSESTILGNVRVRKSFLSAASWEIPADSGIADASFKFTAIDQDLYDENAIDSNKFNYVPRYVKITLESDGDGTWFNIHIMQPELTTLNTAEGSIVLNPNLTLDNPYALRDVYNAKVAAISGILPYESPTDIVNDQDSVDDYTVAQLTERVNVKGSGQSRLVNGISKGFDYTKFMLKAFCKIPDISGYYCTWECTYDDVKWYPLQLSYITDRGTPSSEDYWVVQNLNYSAEYWDGLQYSEEHETLGRIQSKYLAQNAYPFKAGTSGDLLDIRPDVLVLNAYALNIYGIGTELAQTRPVAFRFSILTDSGNVVNGEKLSSGPSSKLTGRVLTVLDSQTYRLNDVAYTKAVTLDAKYPNAATGEKVYYKKSLYSFGSESFTNFVYRSDTGSAITPLYNILDLDATNGVVCNIVPWRDYLVSFTETAIYLSTTQENGFHTKVLTTFTGVPFSDRHSVQSTLNGVIFKAGDKVYMAYPNLYSGDDTSLNLTEVSKPVAHILEELPEDINVDSHIVSDKYTLLMSSVSFAKTLCLQYDLSTKTWEYYTYPIAFSKFFKDVFGTLTGVHNSVEYTLFEESLSKKYPGMDLSAAETVREEPFTLLEYCDVVYVDMRIADTGGVPTAVKYQLSKRPIHFELDTGQKTDNIVSMKHFVESRVIFMTEDESEDFPVDLTITVDGDPHVTTVSTTTDLSTDAAFWKIEDSVGVAGTAFRLTTDPEDTLFGRSKSGMFRQLAVRYSGKGRSIRHILTGESKSNFRIYETYIKYKVLKS